MVVEVGLEIYARAMNRMGIRSLKSGLEDGETLVEEREPRLYEVPVIT